MEHQETILPVPQCLEQTLRECIMPKAHRDDAVEFRSKNMQLPEVQAALAEGRPRLQAWFATIPLDENQKVGITQWVSTLEALNVLGTFTCTQGSDIVGDDRVGTEFKCRLSVPQAKAAFVNAQKETGGAVGESANFSFRVSPWSPILARASLTSRPTYPSPHSPSVEDVALDFEELLECVARCGVDKYRAIEQVKVGEKVAAMIANILGDANEEQVVTAATYISAERFALPASTPHGPDWLATFGMLQLSTLPGFPLWEKDIFDVLSQHLEALHSIFNAYSCSSLDGASDSMDKEEFHDFVVEADLVTDMYGFDTMSGQVSAQTIRAAYSTRLCSLCSLLIGAPSRTFCSSPKPTQAPTTMCLSSTSSSQWSSGFPFIAPTHNTGCARARTRRMLTSLGRRYRCPAA